LIWSDLVYIENWAVEKLDWLPEGNPLSVLASQGTESYLIFYTVTISRADDIFDLGLFEFTRFTGFFVEPTDVAFVLGSLLLLSIARTQDGQRAGIISLPLLSFMFVWAFAASGFIALAVALCLRLMLMQVRPVYVIVRIVGAGLFAGAIATLIVEPQLVIALFGQHKVGQFYFFSAEIFNALDVYIDSSPFGKGINAELGHRTYGILAALAQLGWLPFAVLTCYMGLLLMASVRLLRTRQWAVGAAGVFLLIMSLKYPDIVTLYFLIVSIYVMKLSMQIVPRAPV